MKKYFLYSSLIHLLVISALVILLVELEYLSLSSGNGGNITPVSVYNDIPTKIDSLSSSVVTPASNDKSAPKLEKESVKTLLNRPKNDSEPLTDTKKRYKIAENSSKISKVQKKEKLSERHSDIKTEKETETGGNDYRKGENLTSTAVPEYGINPKPKYPLSARRRGYEGEVIFRVLVLDSGDVGELEILKTSGHDILDNSAHTTLQKWKFIPRKLNGRSVSSWVQVPILFRLNDA